MLDDHRVTDGLGTWLYNLRNRVDLLNRKYAAKRGALIPVLFTGSIDDLRVVSTVRRRERPSPAMPLSQQRADDRKNDLGINGGANGANDNGGANDNDGENDNGSSVVDRAAGLATDNNDDETHNNNRRKENNATSNNVTLLTRDLSTFDDLELNEWCKIFQEYWLTLQRTTRELLHRFEHGSRSSNDSTDPPASKSFLSLNNERYIALSLELIIRVFEDDKWCPGTTDSSTESDMVGKVYRRLSFENRYLSKRIIERSEIIHPATRSAVK